MAKFPAMHFYTDAYLGDTIHLTTLQHGAYLLLLMAAWRTDSCSLPNDDALLARYTRMDLRLWKRHRAVIMAFWTLNINNEFQQLRQVDERKIAEVNRERATLAGRANVLKRHNTKLPRVDAELSLAATSLPLPPEEEYAVAKKDEKDDDFYCFSGTVVKLTEKSWKSWLVKFNITHEDLNGLMIERDAWLRTLEPEEPRRARWFMPTEKWLAGQAENVRKSRR